MATTDTFKTTIITPERMVLDKETTFVAFPAHDGEMGVLHNRAPLLCKLGIGELRLETTAGENQRLYIDGGFAQMVDNRLTLLTEQARQVDELETDAARQAMVEAQAMTITDDESFEERQKAIQRAQTQLKLLGQS